MSIPIRISDQETIDGSEPILVLGPNGSGKSRYGVRLAKLNNAEVVGALRNIALPPDIPMQSLTQAEQQLTSQKQQRRKRPWTISGEINFLFSKLMGEDSAAAIEFRDNYAANPDLRPTETKLMRLASIWQSLFPGRTISFKGYTPLVTSEYAPTPQAYAAQQMSDGERVALYLAGRVLDATSSIIVVDEPEVHFHSRLAVRFWDELEEIRNDCRFVYITHDLAFALSRETTRFLMVRTGQEPELIDLSEGVPSDLSEQILSAASFSIFANTLVFCEGTESSIDQKVLRAYYADRGKAVVPVGSCRDVIRCASTFSGSNLLTNISAVGLIDDDYWPDIFLESLPEAVTHLRVHEMESLLCIRSVFRAIAGHFGRSEKDSESLYVEFLEEARGRFVGGLLNKQISERYRVRCEHNIREAMNGLEISDTLDTMRENHRTALSPDSWRTDPADLFDAESSRLTAALSGDEADFLRMFPGKVYLGILAGKVGMEKPAYIQLVVDALNSKSGDELYNLGQGLRTALNGTLPNIG